MSGSVIVSITAESGSLQFPPPDVGIAIDAMPSHWAFYFQGSCFMMCEI